VTGRAACLCLHRFASPGGDVEVKQLRSRTVSTTLSGFDVAVDQLLVGLFHPLLELSFRQIVLTALGIQFLKAGCPAWPPEALSAEGPLPHQRVEHL
jgi:hypothetical protein